MRQAIMTKYLGPSMVNYVKATSASGISLYKLWDDALNVEENHTAAAKALIVDLAWDDGKQWQGGVTKEGCVFVQIDNDVFTL